MTVSTLPCNTLGTLLWYWDQVLGRFGVNPCHRMIGAMQAQPLLAQHWTGFPTFCQTTTRVLLKYEGWNNQWKIETIIWRTWTTWSTCAWQDCKHQCKAYLCTLLLNEATKTSHGKKNAAFVTLHSGGIKTDTIERCMCRHTSNKHHCMKY